MSAILGIYNRDRRPLSQEPLIQMVETLAHRGPDGAGTWVAGEVGLGQLRSRWMDGPNGVLKSGAAFLTADVRLDNRKELLEALEIAHKQHILLNDETIVLLAYAKWGSCCAERLLGDFAFAIWDDKRKRLFCARDHLGVKPFYYYYSRDLFVFASEIKALFQVSQVSRDLNKDRIADYLAMNFEDKESTFYQRIHRLLPGSSMIVSQGKIEKRTYWTLSEEDELHLKSTEEYDEAFREIFNESVKCRTRTRSRQSVGCLLSGGLDSTAIVCASNNINAESDAPAMMAFSARFPDFPKIDEGRYLDIVACETGISPENVRVDNLDPYADLETMLWHEDGPFHVPNLYVYWSLAKAAHKRGVKVLIDGIDGDTTVSHGFEYLTELFWKRKWGAFAHEIGGVSGRFGQPRLSLLWQYGLSPAFSSCMRSLRRGDSREEPPLLMSASLSNQVGWPERNRMLLQGFSKPVRTLREEHRRSLASGNLSFFLEVNNKASSAFGIDSRHPFFDKRLVEFCLSLPPDQKMKDGWDRLIMRRALKGILPERIRKRLSKSDWGPSFDQGILANRQLLDKVIQWKELLGDFVNLDALKRIYSRAQGNRIQPDDTLYLWLSAMLAIWLSGMEKVAEPTSRAMGQRLSMRSILGHKGGTTAQ